MISDYYYLGDDYLLNDYLTFSLLTTQNKKCCYPLLFMGKFRLGEVKSSSKFTDLNSGTAI